MTSSCTTTEDTAPLFPGVNDEIFTKIALQAGSMLKDTPDPTMVAVISFDRPGNRVRASVAFMRDDRPVPRDDVVRLFIRAAMVAADALSVHEQRSAGVTQGVC